MITHCFRGGHRGRSGWWVGITYDEDLVARIKAAIPAADRSWSDAEKQWWIAQEQEAALLGVLPGFAAFLHQPALF